MLTLNQNGGFMPGVYVNQGRIIGAIDISGQPTYGDSPESIRDLAVELEIDIGKDWTKKVILKGNLKKDPNNIKRIDWGSAFIIKEFFVKTGCFRDLAEEEIKDKLKIFSNKDIPPDFLIKIKGKQVYLVDYVKGVSDDGRLKYGTWNIVDTDEDKLKSAFTASLRRGYPSNYSPGVLHREELKTSTAEVANSQAPEEDDFIF